MAKIKFGAIVTDMRGKVGSQVFSKNRFGAYARGFKVNVISATPAQITARNRLATFSTAWRSLLQSTRDAWNEAVPNFKHTNIFGSIISPSGFDLYVKLNCNLDQIGIARLVNPPSPGLIQNVSNLSIAADQVAGTLTISFDDSLVSADHYFIFSTTNCISPGIKYVKNLLRAIAIVPQGTASPYNAFAEFIAKYGALVASQRISVSCVSVNSITGQKSAPVYATTLVAGLAGLDYTEALDTGIPLT